MVVNYANYTVQTNFNAPGILEYGPQQNALVSSIVYPDGSQVSFTYEATPGFGGAVTGRIASITLPTGGKISYNYSGGYNGILSDGSTAGMSRTTSDGTTTYARVQQGTLWETTVTDAANNGTVYDFSDIYETQRRFYQGAAGGTLIKSLSHCYNSNSTSCETATVTAPISSHFTYAKWPNGRASAVGAYFNSLGLPTQVNEYDSSPTLTRYTVTNYASLGNNIQDRPSDVTVYDANGTQWAQTKYIYDEANRSPGAGRGNLTTVQRWLNTTEGTLDSHFNYDGNGQITATVDALGRVTSYAYACAGAYASQVIMPDTTSPLLSHHSTSAAFDCNTGLPASSTDQNNQTTTYFYDAMLRLTDTLLPDGGETKFVYSAATASSDATIETKQKQNASTWSDQFSYFDGYGRPSKSCIVDPEGNDCSETSYDARGLVASVTNPHRGAESYGVTSYTYDAMGRPITVTKPDNKQVTLSYTVGGVFCTTTRDEDWNQSLYCKDGLGRPNSAWENPASYYATNYHYDVLDNLTQIDQKGPYASTSGWRSRFFAYDSLSRLISEYHSESGFTCYGNRSPQGPCNGDGYDAAGNLLIKTDARRIVTSMTYDELNRILSQSSSDANTPAQHWGYDHVSPTDIPNAVGRLAFTYRGASPLVAIDGYEGYDAMGRALGADGCRPSDCSPYKPWRIHATYDLAGQMTSLTYPSGRVIKQGFDAAGHLTGIDGYYSAPSHTPSGAAQSFTLGNRVREFLQFNSRAQLSMQTIQGQRGQPLVARGLQYTSNGLVDGITDYLESGRSQWFGYDSLNRLTGAGPTDGAKTDGAINLTYSYDPWGNLQQAGTYDTNNRIVGFTYDAAGNVIGDGAHTYTYDGFGMMRAVDGGATATYSYGNYGERVRKVAGGKWREYVEFGGNIIAEKDQTGAWTDYIFAEGRRIAKASAAGTLYYHADHLGSTRLMTDGNGSVVANCYYAPFGQTACSPSVDEHYQFAELEHDAESSLDHAGFRQYASSQGRFLSPDPYSGSIDLSNPQSLNRYAYALNNPINFVDPLGLCGEADQWDPSTNTLTGSIPCDNWIQVGKRMELLPEGSVGQADNTLPTAPALPKWQFTFGVRGPNQTFGNCMQQHAQDYSMVGAVDLSTEVATGQSLDLGATTAGKFLGGNHLNSLLFAEDVGMVLVHNAPAPAAAGLEQAAHLAYQTSFNYTQYATPFMGGGAKFTTVAAEQAARVGNQLTRTAGLAEGLGKAFDLGMSVGTRWAVDFGLTGAEAIGCFIPATSFDRY